MIPVKRASSVWLALNSNFTSISSSFPLKVVNATQLLKARLLDINLDINSEKWSSYQSLYSFVI